MQHLLKNRTDVGSYAHVIQYNDHEFNQTTVDRPVLAVVVSGKKTIRLGKERLSLTSGQAALIAPYQTIQIANHPAANGEYLAYWLSWDEGIIDQYTRHNPDMATAPAMSSMTSVDLRNPHFNAAIELAKQAIIDTPSIPQSIAQHRMQELLFWLAEQNIYLAAERQPTVSHKVRQHISQAPDQEWSVFDLASRLAMSEATLRRRLNAEMTSFSQLLIDVRMSQALVLLQSTSLPVIQIAQDVGYQSASRFAARFRQHFGFVPNVVRQSGTTKRASA